jgi:hypothetical protein
MTNDQFANLAREMFGKYTQQPSAKKLQDLQNAGVVDKDGDVRLWWDADFAIIAVRRSADGKSYYQFRCLKPVFGMPGMAEIDIYNDSMVKYVKDEKKKVITATLDPTSNRWVPGSEVEVVDGDHLRTRRNESTEDNLSKLPEFQTSTSRR